MHDILASVRLNRLSSHENDNWKKSLALPAKDVRPQTEVITL